MELRLDGKVALVTGGSRGIGQAIALAFARSGANVMITSRKEDGLVASAGEINARLGEGSGEVAWRVANAGDADAAESTAQAVLERFGRLDIPCWAPRRPRSP